MKNALDAVRVACWWGESSKNFGRRLRSRSLPLQAPQTPFLELPPLAPSDPPQKHDAGIDRQRPSASCYQITNMKFRNGKETHPWVPLVFRRARFRSKSSRWKGVGGLVEPVIFHIISKGRGRPRREFTGVYVCGTSRLELQAFMLCTQ